MFSLYLPIDPSYKLPFGVGLILGTVYLRHHYVIDLIAGFVLCIAALWYAPKLEDWWEGKKRV